jgi:hypothetical protein
MVTIDSNEVKKDLFKSKNMAKFSHYISGNLYYTVDVLDGTYQFPIATIESANDGEFNVQLSSDLGTTPFNSEVRGSELSRWINKTIKDGTFIKL